LAAADFEGDDDLGDPAEQGEQPDPDQQQRPCTDRDCWEAQKPSRISRMPATVPSHQALLIPLASTEVMMSSVPRKMSSSPRIEASVQNAL
jgi:hypothetical protein